MRFSKKSAAAGVVAVLCFSGLGCDGSSEMSKKSKDGLERAEKKAEEVIEKAEVKIKEGAETAKRWTAEAIAKAKEEYAQHSGTHFEQIELKLKELSGEAQADAHALYEKLKEKSQEVKDAAPEKFEELKKECSDLITQLKTKLGI